MADIVDRGNDTEEFFRKLALSSRMPVGPEPYGYCHNCGEEFDNDDQRWCDRDCRDEWELRSAR